MSYLISLGIGSPASIGKFVTFGLGSAPPVTVPDVVGQDQASATAEIEALGLIVSVLTAYSSVVPAGNVISQDPAASTEVAPGSTVTITVSLGDEPVAPRGGGGKRRRGIYYQGKRKPPALIDLPNQHLDDILARVEAEVLHGDLQAKDVPAEVKAEVRGIVAPHVDKQEQRIDFEAMDRDAAATRKLLKLWLQLQRRRELEQDDEEWFLLGD